MPDRREKELGVPPIKVDAEAAASRLLHSPQLVYPKAATEGGIHGKVRLQILIGKDGRVVEAMVISGDPRLAPAAVQVVNGQLYRPTLLNGQPIELLTEIEFNFKLP
jgi:protein TonB